MGTLIYRENIIDPTWYFADVHFDEGRYVYEWPSKHYPFSEAINQSDLSGDLKIEIRRWIEKNIAEEVIYDLIDKTYYHSTGPADTGRLVSNYWYNFYFRDSESVLAFKLRFGNVIKKITDKHPRYMENV